MNRTVRSMLEWITAAILVIVFLKVNFFSYGGFNPKKVHEQSERTYHYGPSKIIKEVDFENVKIYLGTYKDWFSTNTVIKRGVKWFPGSGVGGMKINEREKVSYSWSESKIHDELRMAKWFGYVTDPGIATIELEVEEAGERKSLRQPIGDDRMFLFVWNSERNHYTWTSLRGIDREGRVMYEKKLN